MMAQGHKAWVLDYVDKSGSFHANFPLVCGQFWAGVGVDLPSELREQGVTEGHQVLLPRTLLAAAFRGIPDYCDMIIFPEGGENTCSLIASIITTGRSVV